MRVRYLFGLFSVAACAGTPVLEGPAPALLPPPPSPEQLPPPLKAPPGKLYRDDVVQAVDAGFPTFLQKVEVEAELQDGKFVGWRVLSLHPPDFWAGVDLMAGDIVTAVNRMPIEREMQAFAVFQALKTAPRLDVSLVRARQVRALGYEIVARPSDARVARSMRRAGESSSRARAPE